MNAVIVTVATLFLFLQFHVLVPFVTSPSNVGVSVGVFFATVRQY
jgi:hypothetical protein